MLRPFSGWQVPLAALLSEGDSVRLVKSETLPALDLLGHGATRLMAHLIQQLELGAPLHHLPASMGPQVELSPVQSLPAQLPRPEQWLRTHVLERRVNTSDDQHSGAPVRAVQS